MPVYSFSSDPLYVAEGQTIQFRYEAPPGFNAIEQVTIQIGELTTFWIIETRDEDFEPDGYELQDIDPAQTDTVFTYAETAAGPDEPPFGGGGGPPLRTGEEVITITGLSDTTQAPISISSNVVNSADYAFRIRRWNGTSYDPWPAFTTGDNVPAGTIFVSNQDQIQVRLKSSSAPADVKRVNVTVGTGSATWNITTGPLPVNIPNPAPEFGPLNGLDLDVQIYSNVVQINGLTTTADIAIDNSGEVAVSNSSTTSTNDDGYAVLTGVTWFSSTTVSNGQYVQLRGRSSVTPNTDKIFSVDIGSAPGIAAWNTRTGNGIDDTPDIILFTDLSNIIPGTNNIGSNVVTISGLTDGLFVPVVIREVETTDQTISNPRIRINGSSSGTFSNVTVENDDEIQLIVDSDPNVSNPLIPGQGSVSLAINVGDRLVPAWNVTNWTGPDTTPAFTQPTNLTNQVPGGVSVVGPIGLTDFNLDITVSVTTPQAYDETGSAVADPLGEVLISVNGDTAVAGPRIVSPDNTGNPVSITFFVNQPGNANIDPVEGLSWYSEFDITIGDAPTFTFRSFNYAVKPVPPSYKGIWYSNKNEFFDEVAYEAAGSPAANSGDYYRAPKFDGYSLGTVLPVTKENINGYGDLEARFPGFMECDGRSLNAADYPFLFDAIGSQYGGNGEYNPTTKEYTGTFNLPDYRNRRLVGTGIVDGNRGSSAFLEATNSGGSFEITGSSGGFWYVSDVGVAGPDPIEQVTVTSLGQNTGTTSDFFELGTPRTFGTELLETEVDFNVVGSVNAVIGPVGEIAVRVPQHEHFVITGVPADFSGDPVIPWNARAYYGTAEAGDGTTAEVSDEPSSDTVYNLWTTIGGINSGVFSSELGDMDGSTLRDYLPLGPEDGNTNATFGNYWGTTTGPLTSLSPSTSYFRQSGTMNDAAVLDTTEDSTRVDAYISIYGELSHSHLLGEDKVDDPNTDYTYGNSDAAGAKRGLANFSNVHTLTFNQADVAIELNTAAFSWNNATKPIPTVALDPQRKVPILAPFHKIKYIIKVY
ncbi:short tail fiber [Synechococcus phage S-PM2]|uniref:Short tail fiber n=1 Tax=Synechococcus phage S-PM2 TaxID=238854 RepID=Q5GQB3_BPSYP|nr:short tail fiber protein [Synechococcus phage S-PM2]CAF34289.1 short tail fiber [Synechococcus phage S-PM2]CFW42461.1 short tail fiber [Synechococcus phage S-PM2]